MFSEKRICVICGKEYNAKMYRQQQCNSAECRRIYNLEGVKIRNKRRVEREKVKRVQERQWNNLPQCVLQADALGLSYGYYMAMKGSVPK